MKTEAGNLRRSNSRTQWLNIVWVRLGSTCSPRRATAASNGSLRNGPKAGALAIADEAHHGRGTEATFASPRFAPSINAGVHNQKVGPLFGRPRMIRWRKPNSLLTEGRLRRRPLPTPNLPFRECEQHVGSGRPSGSVVLEAQLSLPARSALRRCRTGKFGCPVCAVMPPSTARLTPVM